MKPTTRVRRHTYQSELSWLFVCVLLALGACAEVKKDGASSPVAEPIDFNDGLDQVWADRRERIEVGMSRAEVEVFLGQPVLELGVPDAGVGYGPPPRVSPGDRPTQLHRIRVYYTPGGRVRRIE